MKLKTLAITGGAVLALAGGLYLGSGAQAGTCTIGGDTGPGVPVRLAAQQETPQPAPAAPKDQQDKPAPAQPAAQKGKEPQQKPAPQAGAPIVPIIAPDEGC